MRPDSLLRPWRYINHLLSYLLTYIYSIVIRTHRTRRCCVLRPVCLSVCIECATVAEYRDLLSEFNLLKDVDHVNIIKLLGICTRDG